MVPGDPGFREILSTPPPNWQERATGDGDCFIASYDQGGVLQQTNWQTAMEYVWGGEYEALLYDPVS